MTKTITPETAARIVRMEEADAKKLISSKKNLMNKYGLTQAEADTARVVTDLAGPSKIQVTYACRSCGKPVTRYTSDLFVSGPDGKAIQGKVRDCQECLKKNKNDDKSDMKALNELRAKAKKMGVELLVDGKINPILVVE